MRKNLFTHYKRCFKNLNWKFVIVVFVLLNGVNMLDGIYFDLLMNIGLVGLVLCAPFYDMSMENHRKYEDKRKKGNPKKVCHTCGKEE